MLGGPAGVAAVRETPRGAAQQGMRALSAPPPRGPDPNPAERQRAATGVLAPPPPFTAFIAPH